MIASFANPKITAVNSVANRYYNAESVPFRSNGVRSDCFPNDPVESPQRILRYDDPFHYEKTTFSNGRLAAPRKPPLRELCARPFIGFCTNESGISRTAYHQPSFYLSAAEARESQQHEQSMARTTETKKMAVQNMVANRKEYTYRDETTDSSDPSGLFPTADGDKVAETDDPIDDSEPTEPEPEFDKLQQQPSSQQQQQNGDGAPDGQGVPPGKGTLPSTMYGRPA